MEPQKITSSMVNHWVILLGEQAERLDINVVEILNIGMFAVNVRCGPCARVHNLLLEGLQCIPLTKYEDGSAPEGSMGFLLASNHVLFYNDELPSIMIYRERISLPMERLGIWN